MIKDIIHTFEKASGARLNSHKCKALAIAGWDATNTGLGIDFQPSIKILGITFTSTIARSALLCWEPMTNLIQAQARLAYGRKLCIPQRVQYVQTMLLARKWYMTDLSPIQSELQSSDYCYTLVHMAGDNLSGADIHTPKKTKQGGWALVDIAAKCKTILLNRMWIQSNKEGTATVA